jgi:C-1 hydroxylase
MARDFAPFLTAFPHAHLEVVHLFGEGDRLFGWYHVTATHTGPFFDIEPSGQRLEFGAGAVYRFEDAVIVEAWAMDDVLSIIVELGVLPVASAAS